MRAVPHYGTRVASPSVMGADRPVAAVAGNVADETEEWLSPADELFARLVHDLRNPLGIIAGFAETLSEAPADERDDLVERLRVNVQRALHVVEELSLLADLRAGRVEPAALDECDLASLLAGIAAAVERRPADIRIDAAGSPCARLPRTHLTCALRTVLRSVLHQARPDDRIELSATATPAGVTFRIAVAAPLSDLDVELPRAVATLYAGRCDADSHRASTAVTLSIPAGD